MTRIVLRRRARAEIGAAVERYQAESPSAADAFFRTVQDALAAIAENSRQFHVLRGRLRRVILRRFPYGVYYKIYPDHISVVGVIHLRRDPRRWLVREAPGITVSV